MTSTLVADSDGRVVACAAPVVRKLTLLRTSGAARATARPSAPNDERWT